MVFELHPQLAADTTVITEWSLSSVLLMNDSRYPWLILVPRIAGMRDLIDLSPAHYTELTGEIDRASRALKTLFTPHKLNIAALGNIVEQLHVHVIARQTEDDAWPAPVWGKHPALPYGEDTRNRMIEQLLSVL